MRHVFISFQTNNSKDIRDEDMFRINEIVSFGAVMFDEKFNYIKGHTNLVKPMIYTSLNSKTKERIGMNWNKLHCNGKKFRIVLEKFNNFLEEIDEDYLIYVWGNKKFDTLFKNCQVKEIPEYLMYWTVGMIDLQDKFRKKQLISNLLDPSLDDAIEYFNIREKYLDCGKRHIPSNDVKYMAYVYKEMMESS